MTGLAELDLAPALALIGRGFLRSRSARPGGRPSSGATMLTEGEGSDAAVVVRLGLGVALMARAEVEATGPDGWSGMIDSVFQYTPYSSSASESDEVKEESCRE